MLKQSLCLVLGFMCIGDACGSTFNTPIKTYPCSEEKESPYLPQEGWNNLFDQKKPVKEKKLVSEQIDLDEAIAQLKEAMARVQLWNKNIVTTSFHWNYNKEYEEKLKAEEEEKPYMPMLYWNSWEGDWNFNSKSVNSFEGTEEDLQNIDLSEFSNDDLADLATAYYKLSHVKSKVLYTESQLEKAKFMWELLCSKLDEMKK